jgi:nucleoside-diphosphate-sugar epimerase
MKIVVIGGTGLIGSKTVAILRQRGHKVVAASAHASKHSGSDYRWLRCHRWSSRRRPAQFGRNLACAR